MYPSVQVKPGKENNLIFRHPWVFSGALQRRPEGLANGEVVQVLDVNGVVRGVGIYSEHSQITVRVLEFGPAAINADWFRQRFAAADSPRRLLGLGPDTATTGYRLIFGEADGIPGLVVDRYADVFVIQSSVAGIDRLKTDIVTALTDLFQPRAIVERSDLPARREEEIDQTTGMLHGSLDAPVAFTEFGVKFEADIIAGQKTGFYLDQRDLRQAVRTLAQGREVLNLFSNSGSFSIVALLGGATKALNIDSSHSALEQCFRFAELNGLDRSAISDSCIDVFDWLTERQPPSYDLIILDPPALIKAQNDTEAGKKAYHFLNRAAIRLLRPGGILVTSSCSAFFREDDFLFMLRRAAVQAERRLEILRYVPQSPDHPWSVYFPESKYLKSFIALVP
ncbi:MAG: class I SAM-dependent rRNA methyltransferase [candidate division Zixibacteria bacterium]|nr:class I SAM-dependent rRNA methyltransferase [candidate division Zixibacteria bacterium]